MRLKLTIWTILVIITYMFVPGYSLPTNDTDKANTPLSSNSYPYHVELDDNYELSWSFNDTHIVFETKVNTTGYVGFGISPNGAMMNSDIVIGWVKDGQSHFMDRHGIGHVVPVVDTSQDWTLLSASENLGITTLTMVRLLDTGDSDDMPILDGTTRVIFSYNDQDPETDDAILYHMTHRGTKALLLLDPPTADEDTTPLSSDALTLDFLNNNHSVSSDDTEYHCSLYKLPDLKGQKHHLIRYEPVIQEGHENLVHHMLLYYCTGTQRDDLVGKTVTCPSTPSIVNGPYLPCYGIFIAWAIGGRAVDFPAHVGMPLGITDDPAYFVLETHYDNPQMRSDFVDSSGLRLTLTSTLRQHDGGIFELGILADHNQIIPPHAPSFISRGFCSQECIEGLGDLELNVFGSFLHSHLLGRKLRTRIFRNGIELPPISEDNNYDFNFQEQRMLREERIVKKGDSMIAECEYDSTGRDNITYGGFSTQEEMCLAFLLYYPKSDYVNCISKVNVDDAMKADLYTKDWTNAKVREDFQREYDSQNVTQICVKKTSYSFKISVPEYPKKYKPNNTCSLDGKKSTHGLLMTVMIGTMALIIGRQ